MSYIYIACEDMDFTWRQEELRRFEKMWIQSMPIEEIATELNRDVDEVAVLVIDFGRQGKIQEGKPMFNPHSLPRKPMVKKDRIDVVQLQKMYLDRSITVSEIADYFGVHPRRITLMVQKEREKNPAKWPNRIERRK